MVVLLPILGHFFGAAFLWRVYIRTFGWKVSLRSRNPFLVSDQKQLYPLNPISTYEFSRLISIHFLELKHVKAWLNFWSQPPHEDKAVFLLRPRILILKVAKNFRENFFRGVELIRVEVM